MEAAQVLTIIRDLRDCFSPLAMTRSFDVAYISAIVLGLTALVFVRSYYQQREDIQRLKTGLRALLRKSTVPHRLSFSSSDIEDVWRSILTMATRNNSKINEKPAYEEVISASSNIASSAHEISATADAVVKLLLRQTSPSVCTIAIVLKDRESSELRLEKASGIPEKRIEQTLLGCFDRVLDFALEEKVGLWGYHDSSEGSEFDFSAFGIGMSLLVPLRDDQGICGGIWLGFREGSASLNPGRKAFVQAVSAHAAASFYAAQTVRSKTQEKDREKDFLIGMSHDLRAPGNSALYAIDDLLRGELGTLTPEQHLRLNIVEQALRDQLDILGDVLDFAKHQKGALEAKPVVVNLGTILKGVTESFSLSAERKGLRLECEDMSSIQVMADPHHLKRILVNYFSNAVKYTDKGEIVLRSERSDTHLVLHLSDTGPGVREEDVPRLFSEFTRFGNGRGKTGAGLGLALTRALARLNNGDAWFTANPKGGSVFSVSFELTEEQAKANKQTLGSVLIVDDDAAACRTNSRYLRDISRSIRTATSCKKAFELACKEKPDLIVTDLRLDDGTALDLTRELSQRDIRIPTILISGSAHTEEIRELEEDYRVVVMEKPVDRRSLQCMASHALEERSQ